MAKITAIGIAVAICIGLVGYALYWDTTEAPKLKAQAEEYVEDRQSRFLSQITQRIYQAYPNLQVYNSIRPGILRDTIAANTTWSYRVTDIYKVRATAFVDFTLEDPEVKDYRRVLATYPYDISITSKGINHQLTEVMIRSSHD